MIKLLLAILLLSGQAWANTSAGWYGTLQGNNSDVQSGSIPDGSTLQYNSSTSQWTFSYATVPAGGSTGYVLTKNSGSDYDYSWQASSGGGGGGNVGIGTNNYLSQYTGTSTLGPSTVIDVNGNVGIGTTTASQTLTVNGTMDVVGGQNVGIGSTNPGTALDVQGTLRSLTGIINGSSGNNLTPGTIFDVNGTVQSFNVNTNGNVSIGSVTANSSLEVTGIILGTSNIESTGSGVIIGGISNAGLSNTTFLGGASATSVVNFKSTTANGTTDYINFNVGNNGGTRAITILDNSGVANVGIGSTNPGQLLDVKGTVRIIGGSGSASTATCWCSDGITLGHATACATIVAAGGCTCANAAGATC